MLERNQGRAHMCLCSCDYHWLEAFPAILDQLVITIEVECQRLCHHFTQANLVLTKWRHQIAARGRKTDLDHKARSGAPCPNWMQFLISKTEQHFSRHICGIHVTQENPWTPSHLVVPTEVLMSLETHHLPEPFVDEIILRLLLLTPYWGEGSLTSCRWMTARDKEESCSGKNGGSTGQLLPSSWPRRSTWIVDFCIQGRNIECFGNLGTCPVSWPFLAI